LANGFPVSESFSFQDWNIQYREMVYLARQGDRPCFPDAPKVDVID
jgi:hypothetical protein